MVTSNNLEYLHPLETWCKIKCIKDDDDCMFKNACGYRAKILGTLTSKKMSSKWRFIRYNGFAESPTYKDLVKLFRVYLLSGFHCWYCAEPMVLATHECQDNNVITIDHRIPLTNGGRNIIDNMVFCCRRCNRLKGAGIYPVGKKPSEVLLLEEHNKPSE